MSNMNKTSSITKLRGNDSNRYYTHFQSCSDTDVEPNTMASDFLSSREQYTVENNFMPGPTSKAHSSKHGGRGLIIKQLLEESKNKNSNCFMKKSTLDFSNSNIEQHFKQLRDNNEKKIREENEMKWKTMFNSDISS